MPALVQGGKEEEHEDENERHHHPGLSFRFLLLEGKTAPFRTDVVGQVFTCEFFDGFHGLSRAVTRCGLAVDDGCREHVESLDRSGSRGIFRFTESRQGPCFPWCLHEEHVEVLFLHP